MQGRCLLPGAQLPAPLLRLGSAPPTSPHTPPFHPRAPPGASELSEMFKQLGQPISHDKLVDIFMKVMGWPGDPRVTRPRA